MAQDLFLINQFVVMLVIVWVYPMLYPREIRP